MKVCNVSRSATPWKAFLRSEPEKKAAMVLRPSLRELSTDGTAAGDNAWGLGNIDLGGSGPHATGAIPVVNAAQTVGMAPEFLTASTLTQAASDR
jgi:hypothetical protein